MAVSNSTSGGGDNNMTVRQDIDNDNTNNKKKNDVIINGNNDKEHINNKMMENTNKTLSSLKDNLNIAVFHGIRCLLCFIVVNGHCHQFNGGSLLFRNSICGQSLNRIPFFGWLLYHQTTIHMNLFWFISGFLCEYQLHHHLIVYKQQQNNNEKINNNRNNNESNAVVRIIKYKEFMNFMVKRIVRIYPFYLLMALSGYLSNSKRLEQMPGLPSYDEWELFKTLLFVKKWNPSATQSNPAAIIWSLAVDVHGYVFLTILFALTYKFTYYYDTTTNNKSQSTFIKRCILFSFYIFSVLNMVSYRPFSWQNLSPEAAESYSLYGPMGIDTYTETKLIGGGLVNGFADRIRLYPNYDFDNDEIGHSIRIYIEHVARNVYFTSIFKHAGSIILGALLYMNMYVRDGQSFYPGYKLLFSFLFILITRGNLIFSSITCYFLLDALLTFKKTNSNSNMQQTKISSSIHYYITSRISNAIMEQLVQFLSHPFFQKLSPYTFGIYLFHAVPLILRARNAFPTRFHAIEKGALEGIDACTALEKYAGLKYGFLFVFKESTIVFLLGLLLAHIMYAIIGKPIAWIQSYYVNYNQQEKKKLL